MKKIILHDSDSDTIDLCNIDEDNIFIFLDNVDVLRINPSKDAKVISVTSKSGAVSIYNNLTGAFVCRTKVGIITIFNNNIYSSGPYGIYMDDKTGYVRLSYDGSEKKAYANYAIDFNNVYSPRSGCNMHNFHMYSEVSCNETVSGNITGYYAHLDADSKSCTRDKEIESISLFKGIGTYSASATLGQFNGIDCYIFPQGNSGGYIKRIYGGVFGVDFYEKSDVEVDYIVGVGSRILIGKKYSPKRSINYAIGIHGHVDNKSSRRIDSAYGIMLSKGEGANIRSYFGLYIKEGLGDEDYSIYSNANAPSYFKGSLNVDGLCIACYAEVIGDGDIGDPIINMDGRLYFKSCSLKNENFSPVTAIAVQPAYIINNKDMLEVGVGRVFPIVLKGVVLIKRGESVGKGWVYLGAYNSEMEAWLIL